MLKEQRHYHVRIQEEAAEDLDEIYRYVFQDSPARAKLFIRKLKRKILSLKSFPRRGSRARILEEEESTDEIRFIEFQGYLIFYIIDARDVIILHVAGPGKNWIDWFH